MPQISLGAVSLLPDEHQHAPGRPHARATFRMIAFNGSSSERNARASSRNVSAEIRAIISGNEP